MNTERLRRLLAAFRQKRILVVGDLILDEFIWGKVRRISPEAPVPVVEVDRETYYPGGAANVARNLREFDCETSVLGLIGTGAHAGQLKGLLSSRGIGTDALLESTDFQTIVKTRIIARHQQVVRVDRERKHLLSDAEAAAALEKIDAFLPKLDAIILEDYGKGLLQQEFIDAILARAKAARKIVTVDPNPLNLLKWHGVTGITPNRAEAFAAARRAWTDPVEPPGEDAGLMTVGTALLDAWACENLLITLSEQGMMLFRQHHEPLHIPTRARQVFDVSGAGDTAIALFTLGLVAGATSEEAADIANHAGGVVVGKLGTETVTSAELIASFESYAGLP